MRPESLFPAFTPITSLKGCGPKLAPLVEKLVSGGRVLDLWWHLPSGLIDRRYRPAVAEAEPGRIATLQVTIDRHLPPRNNRMPYKIQCHDGSGKLMLVFFNGREDFLKRSLPEGETRVVSGMIELFDSQVQMTHPDRFGTAEEVETLRKALSGIARMCHRSEDGWIPRFGKGRIIAMLVGSRSREVLDARLDELSTYGMLKSVGTPALQTLFRETEKHGLVETVTEGEFPLLRLTTKGAEVMRKGGPVRMAWPDLRKQSTADPRGIKSDVTDATGLSTAELGFDEKLFEKLKKKRAALAAREGVPMFMIFHNNTLEFFTRLKPKTVDAAMKIRGVGEQKAARWLPEFLEVIQKHKGA